MHVCPVCAGSVMNILRVNMHARFVRKGCRRLALLIEYNFNVVVKILTLANHRLVVQVDVPVANAKAVNEIKR